MANLYTLSIREGKKTKQNASSLEINKWIPLENYLNSRHKNVANRIISFYV